LSSPWVRTEPELAALLASLAASRAIALDTESDSLHHHREKVCLVQVAGDSGQAWLVDPLAGLDLRPLGPLLADRAVTKVFHGADYDVTTLKRDFGFTIGGLFDTMIAARFLGLPEIGLMALARAELGVTLTKESQKDDWSVRPLTAAQETYALSDVLHLLALQARLVERLRELGRLSWVEEESEAVAALPAARRDHDPQAWQRVKGARRLPPRGLAVLREAFAWREALAEATDVPAFKLMSAETLLAIAATPPRTLEDVHRLRGLTGRARGQAGSLRAAVARALALAEGDLPRLAPAPRPPVVADVVRRRIDTLRTWRAAEAERLKLDVSVILPQRLLERVADAAPAAPADLLEIEGFRRWRAEAFGPALLAALSSAGMR
jgi:ribonuclease D